MAEEPEPQQLKSWWAGFKRRGKKDAHPTPAAEPPRGIFGVPLADSIKYANVAISLMDENGKSFIYGYVPIVVAKCGVFLKEKATDVEGIFRLSGSAKRIKELQAQFDTPTRYGKGLDWTGYTVHDAANVLRRYLNQLPQPIVPLEAYEKFRNPLRDHQTQAVGDMEAQAQETGEFDHSKAISTYQQLITEMPPLNRQLLLYVLDLLSVFASKSDINRMTSANLAAIFQPGLLSHPVHDMKPQEYRLSQDVLIFLIDNQDSFLIGMNGTAADEKTVREVQSGAPTPQATTPTKTTQSGLGRSASSASAGNDSQRRFAGIRRNLSVSSKNSRNSASANTPNTPSSGQFATGTGGGVYRSNTVPSKKSPALSSRINRGLDSPNTPVALSPALVSPSARSASPGSKLAPASAVREPSQQPTSSSTTPAVEQSSIGATSTQPESIRDHSKERLIPNENTPAQYPSELVPPTANTPGKSRKVSTLLKSSPTSDGKETRQPNKLKKKRMPSSTQPSANSSTHSLQNGEESPRNAAFYTPLVTPGLGLQADPLSLSQSPMIANTAATPATEQAPRVGDRLENSMGATALETSQQPSESTLKPKSPTGSVRSKSSATDLSEQEHGGEGKAEKAEKKRRWRFSSAPKKNDQPPPLASPPLIGANRPAGASSSSVGSWHKTRKSMSNDIPAAPLEVVSSGPTPQSEKSESSGARDKELAEDSEKRGLFGRIRNKIHHAKEERKEREAEKERAKSPPRNASERNTSKQSLNAIAQESSTSNGPAPEPLREVQEPKTVPSTAPLDVAAKQTVPSTPIETELSQNTQAEASASAETEPKTATFTEPVTPLQNKAVPAQEANPAVPKDTAVTNPLFS